MWSAFVRTGELELDEAPGTAIKAKVAAATKIARYTALSVASHIDLAIQRTGGQSQRVPAGPASGRSRRRPIGIVWLRSRYLRRELDAPAFAGLTVFFARRNWRCGSLV